MKELADASKDLIGRLDCYITQNSFTVPRRLVDRLFGLDACFVDLDYYKTSYADRSPEAVADAVLRHLDDCNKPMPSFIMFSGRGLLCCWLLDGLPAAALPRWMAVQKELLNTLRPFGSDANALDAARVFRLAGTINSRSGQSVRPVFNGGAVWRFDDLAEEVLPLTREKLVELRAIRAARAEKRGEAAPKPITRLDARSLWSVRLADLHKIADGRYGGALPPGERDAWMLMASTAMSWLVPAGAMEREIVGLGDRLAGWSERETKARMSTVIKRAQMVEAGRMLEWNGRQRKAQYHFTTANIIDRLSITDAEMRSFDLRALVNEDVKRDRDRARWHKRREAAGGSDRKAWLGAAAARADQAKALREAGMTWQAIAAEMGLSSSDAARKLASRA
jgi:hypothetical protein